MRVASVSQNGAGVSEWLVLDQYVDAAPVGLFLTIGGGATVTLEVTPDNVLTDAATKAAAVAFPLAAPWTAVAANLAGALPFTAFAIRINQTGGGTSKLQAVCKGLQ